MQIYIERRKQIYRERWFREREREESLGKRGVFFREKCRSEMSGLFER